jgi:hypothetical protein
LDGGSLPPGGPAYADSLNTLTYTTRGTIRDVKSDQLLGLVDGRYKYIHHVRRPHESELYDLLDDPGETRNLLPERLAVVRRMQRELKRRTPPPSAAADMPEADRARLEALGYVGGSAEGGAGR